MSAVLTASLLERAPILAKMLARWRLTVGFGELQLPGYVVVGEAAGD